MNAPYGTPQVGLDGESPDRLPRKIANVDYETEYIRRLDNALADIEEVSRKIELLEIEKQRSAQADPLQVMALEARASALHAQLDKLKGSVKKITFKIKEGSAEKEFADALLAVGGMLRLERVIRVQTGNTRAYALAAVQNLLDHDLSAESLSPIFVNLLVHIIVTETLVNLCRPATGIVIKIVISDRAMRAGSPVGSSAVGGAVGAPLTRVPSASRSNLASRDAAATPTPSQKDAGATPPPQLLGVDAVFTAIQNNPKALSILVQRLNATDYFLQTNSMHLINHLYRAAGEQRQEQFIQKLEALRLRRIVLNLMISQPSEELGKELVEFQRLFVQQGHRDKRSVVVGAECEQMLKEIWDCSGMEERDGLKWRLLGFSSEAPRREIQQIAGKYGLQTMHYYVTRRQDDFRKFLVEQSVRAEGKRCPFARAFLDVTQILCDFWELSSGIPTRSVLQPFMLAFEEVQAITFKTLIRLWSEMEAYATGDDLVRVSALVRILITTHLNKPEGTIVIGSIVTVPSGAAGARRPGVAPPDMDQMLSTLEYEMLGTPYTVLREKQLKELDEGNEVMNKPAVRALRESLYQRCFAFVREQRVSCLMAGSWFPIPLTKDKDRDAKRGVSRSLWRFFRLAPNERHLHWGNFSELRAHTRPSLDELPERLDLSLVSDIVSGLSSPLFGSSPGGVPSKKIVNVERPHLTFSLLSADMYAAGDGPDTAPASLADFICDTPIRYSEWIDGFNMLLDRNIATRETGELIRQLCDMNMKVALLDVTGDRIDIPDPVEPPEPPPDFDFYYRDDECNSVALLQDPFAYDAAPPTTVGGAAPSRPITLGAGPLAGTDGDQAATEPSAAPSRAAFLSVVSPSLDAPEMDLGYYHEWIPGDQLLQSALRSVALRKDLAASLIKSLDAAPSSSGPGLSSAFSAPAMAFEEGSLARTLHFPTLSTPTGMVSTAHPLPHPLDNVHQLGKVGTGSFLMVGGDESFLGFPVNDARSGSISGRQ